MEKQAAERETERDEFSKKIEKLESKLRDVDKERLKYENIAKEVCVFNEIRACWIAVYFRSVETYGLNSVAEITLTTRSIAPRFGI